MGEYINKQCVTKKYNLTPITRDTHHYHQGNDGDTRHYHQGNNGDTRHYHQGNNGGYLPLSSRKYRGYLPLSITKEMMGIQDIELIIAMDEIPDDLAVTFDQTGIHYASVSDCTMAEELCFTQL